MAQPSLSLTLQSSPTGRHALHPLTTLRPPPTLAQALAPTATTRWLPATGRLGLRPQHHESLLAAGVSRRLELLLALLQLGKVILLALLQLVTVVTALSQQPLQHLQQGRIAPLAGSVTSSRVKAPCSASGSQWDGARAQHKSMQGTSCQSVNLRSV